MKNIPNPYTALNIPEDQTVRIQADISRQDRNLIRAICPEQGVYGFTIAHLIIKLCHELRKRNITDCSREADFRDAIIKCRIVFDGDNGCETATSGLPNQSAGGSMPKTAGRDDGGRTEAVRSGNSGDEDKSPNIQVSPGGGKQKGHKGAGRVRTVGKDE